MASFKRNLLIGFGVSLLLLFLSSIASYQSIKNLLYSSEQVDHTSRVISALRSVMTSVINAETVQRGFLLTGKEEYLTPYTKATVQAQESLNELSELISDPDQQRDLVNLQTAVGNRLTSLNSRISEKRENTFNPLELSIGKSYMDDIRMLIQNMQNREEALLKSRTAAMNRFATYTPILIVIAAVLAFAVTFFFFSRINREFETRTRLQKSLEENEEATTRRLTLIQEIADKISNGQYDIRVGDEGKDLLGSIVFSLNKMAASLQTSFSQLEKRDWLQTGANGLYEETVGDHELKVQTQKIINYVTEYTNSIAGALYLINKEGQLELTSGYALPSDKLKPVIPWGEGIIGQAAASGKILEVNGIEENDFTLSLLPGELKPRTVIAIPIIYNKIIKGVIELASLKAFNGSESEFFKTVSINAGFTIQSAQSRERLQDLLEETQTQAEELQLQQHELENINAELEVQAEKLQASEEELRVQQEELQQANSELEERSRLLEEKNEMIVERNIEIQAKAEALEISTRYKSEFLANMSHELRTPLNSILLLSRLLSENHSQNLTSDQIEYAQVIQTSGNGLLRLIDEILDLSKIESGKMELEYQDVAISEVTGEMRQLFSEVAKQKGIAFDIHTASNVPELIETDKLRLEQILRNLLSNAIKFTSEGSVTMNIRKEGASILFKISDTGIGIPASKQQHVFEAFQQADGSTRRKYGGTGLGLSISRELSKLLGGEIILKSEEGKGSSFTLFIPLKKGYSTRQFHNLALSQKIEGPLDEIQKEAEPVPQNEFISTNIPGAVPDDRDTIGDNDKVILIVEDDTSFARSLLEFTRSKKYKGLVAVRGDEGIELAKKFHPLGVLLDLQLPVKSGWEVMKELKADPATKHIPVHIMSSHQMRNKSIASGAIDFISKPMAFEKMGEIFQKIENALSNYPKKVMIVEENAKHAKALAYYLENFNVSTEIKENVADGIRAFRNKDVNCVILDMGIPANHSFEMLEEVKKTPGLENLPIIIFTGRNLSQTEEGKIKKYADSIVIKTAHSFQRILDEVSLFLHLVEENKNGKSLVRYKKMGALEEILKNKKVLIADDDVRNIFSLTKALEVYGMEVFSAIDGKEAMQKISEIKQVDIVLMDMMMPEMDGYETIREIRKNPAYRNLPIIAVTAKAMTGDREKCIGAGASDYITKPVDVDQLTSLLRVWLYDQP